MSTNSAIKYIGRAKLTLYRGNKIVRTIEHRNHGTAWLFKVLASALCGKDESLNMPRYFDLGTTDDRGIFTSCLASRPALTAKTLSANDIGAENQIAPGGGAQFTAFIPASAVSDTTNINTLRLLSSYTGADTLLAEI